MNAAIQAVDIRREVGQWFKALMLAGLILGLVMLASGAYVSGDTKLDAVVTKWDSWVKGSPGRLTALIVIGVGSVVAAVKKDWGWFFDAVMLSMDIDVIVGIANANFVAAI